MDDKMEIVEQIKRLLDQLINPNESDDENFKNNFEPLEIPSIVSDIIDYLQPQLMPTEALIYWYLFRKSILMQGSQYCRVSVRGMNQGVVKSNRGDGLSYSTVQDALKGLKNNSVINECGDTNGQGTLYKVNLPDEIEMCQKLKSEISVEIAKPINEENELDYYNNKENRLKIFERDLYTCYYCKKLLTRFTATLDHIQPVSKGGDNSFGNLITACLHCNSRRGNSPVSDAMEKSKLV